MARSARWQKGRIVSLPLFGALARDGSLTSSDALDLIGSLSLIGAHFANGSLAVPVAIKCYGSLACFDAASIVMARSRRLVPRRTWLARLI